MENNSKQAVLSIVGIAVLVIAVVGVSFAFFTYSKTGTTNNVITTGNIVFDFKEDTPGLSLTNQFPQSDADGITNETFDFSIAGTLPTSMAPINYSVYAIKGDVPTVEGKSYTETNRLKNSEINFYVTTSSDGEIQGGYGTADAGAKNYGAAVTDAIASGTSTSGTGLQIATGTIEATGAEVKDSYTITMWVNDTVTISDTDSTKTYCASASAECTANGGRAVYSDLFYSFKIRVDAQG